MMGGGFGGCTLTLLKRDSLSIFKQAVISGYTTPEGSAPDIIQVTISDETKQILNKEIDIDLPDRLKP